MSKSPNPRGRQTTRGGSRKAEDGGIGFQPPKSTSRSRSKSPKEHSSSISPNLDTNAKLEAEFLKMLARGIDGEDDKAIKIPTFSDGTDWEAVVFELEINLEKYWKYKSELDIVEYLNGSTQICDIQYIKKADKMIYHALTTASKRESFARKAIMAAKHDDAVPKVLRNEGLKLFNMFNAIFLNKGKDQANLPNAQAGFFQIKMNKDETAKDYISRVDKAVSDLAIWGRKFRPTLGDLLWQMV
jgi:hypothetical protein